MEKWREELYESNYLAHAGKPGMKWGYTDGHRNGNRIAELVKLNTGMGIRPARPNGVRQIITTRPESGDEHDAPNNSGVRVYKSMNARPNSNIPSAQRRNIPNRKPIGKVYNEKNIGDEHDAPRNSNIPSINDAVGKAAEKRRRNEAREEAREELAGAMRDVQSALDSAAEKGDVDSIKKVMKRDVVGSTSAANTGKLRDIVNTEKARAKANKDVAAQEYYKLLEDKILPQLGKMERDTIEKSAKYRRSNKLQK